MAASKDEKNIPLNEIVPEYNSSFFLVRNLFWSRIKYAVQLGNIDNCDSILDVGCGMGYLIKEVRKKNKECQILGIDFNKNTNSLSVEDCEFREEDVTKLTLEENFFDIVFALDTLEHIKEIECAIVNIKYVLKPNGKLIITGPTENVFYRFCRFLIKGTFSEKEGPGAGVHYYTIETIDEKIRNHSFIKEEKINLPRYFPFVLQKVIKYNNEK